MNRLFIALSLLVAGFCLGLLSPAHAAPIFTTLHSFSALSGTLNSDGTEPQDSLTLGSDGNFYGTALNGGANGYGTIFKMTPSGMLTTLVNFTGIGGSNPGAYPYASLLQGADGNFYGTSQLGGVTTGKGTVFKMTPSGVMSVLYSFIGPDGYLPQAGLTLGADGNFYGTTVQGGAANNGTVFKITPGGTLTTLYSFSAASSGTNGISTNSDGYNPTAGLVLGTDGSFYGATRYGSPQGYGTVFKITPSGTLTTIAAFTGTGGTSPGANPYTTLLLGADADFYGVTNAGGASDTGTVFKVTSAGALTSLYSFSALSGGTNEDGANPQGTLVQGRDGNLYGTAGGGGTSGFGTVFQITTTGELTPLISLTGTSGNALGASATSGLVESSGSAFYGTTYVGGPNNTGTVYEIDVASPPVVALTPGAATPTQIPENANAISGDGGPLDFVWSASPAATPGFTGPVRGTTPSGPSFSNTLVVNVPGTYTITVMVTDGFGQTASASKSATVSRIPASITISPASASVVEGASASLTASVTDQFGAVISAPSLAWSIASGGGTLSSASANPTVYTAPMAAGAAQVKVVSGSASATASVTITLPPAITGFTPSGGPAGTAVTITGTNLSSATVVGFQGQHAASFTVNSTGTQITTTVPSGAVTGPIAVATPGGTARSSASFTVPAPPSITSFSPASGPPGTVVTITGSNFTGTTVVGFTGAHATFTVNGSGTQITATVPAGAVTGPIAVAAPGGTVKSSTNFTVTATIPTVKSLAFSPATILPGGSSTGTVVLTGPAPPGGSVVTIYAGSFTYTSVAVATGQSSGTFTVSTVASAAPGSYTFTASYGATASAVLTISAPVAVKSLAFSPAAIAPGGSSTGTVTLSTAAPAGGASVSVSQGAFSVATVSIAAGQTTGTFTVMTSPSSGAGSYTFVASYNGTSATASLTIN